MNNSRQRFHVNRNSWAAQAERMVRRELEKLPMDGFIVANNVKFRYGNLDHLVIRNDGAFFMIETKSQAGTVVYDGEQLRVNGKLLKKNPFCQIHRNIRWLRGMFRGLDDRRLWITAILVFPFGNVKIRPQVKGVNIVGAQELRKLLRQ